MSKWLTKAEDFDALAVALSEDARRRVAAAAATFVLAWTWRLGDSVAYDSEHAIALVWGNTSSSETLASLRVRIERETSGAHRAGLAEALPACEAVIAAVDTAIAPTQENLVAVLVAAYTAVEMKEYLAQNPPAAAESESISQPELSTRMDAVRRSGSVERFFRYLRMAATRASGPMASTFALRGACLQFVHQGLAESD